MRTRGRPRKRWIAYIEEDMRIMGVRQWRKQCEKQNGRESLRRLKPTVGCSARRRRRRRRMGRRKRRSCSSSSLLWH
jgi:hypothetical protein